MRILIPMKTALLIVDVQNDFCPGGALATARGDEVATRIAELIADTDGQAREYDYVVATQDWHIDPGAHFSEAPDFVDSWPKHCVAGMLGIARQTVWHRVQTGALVPVTKLTGNRGFLFNQSEIEAMAAKEELK